MKVSLAWLFDHIDADCKIVDVPYLVDQFNTKTAEIEEFTKISIDLSQFSLARVTNINSDSIGVECSEWKGSYTLPFRPDACVGNYYVIKQNEGAITWAEGTDWYSNKECLIASVSSNAMLAQGDWKKHVEAEDYIFTVDNKSITHRPDMWGHRGFAREVAALLDLPFKPIEDFLQQKQVAQFDGMIAQATDNHPFTIEVQGETGCRRFAGIYIEEIEYKASLIWMAARLLRIDSKPIDAVVDSTNYVMFDLSQPLHAFDADKISSKTLIPRFAENKEKLLLIDGQEIELTDQDYIISDAKRPLALAGIMGGSDSAITAQTRSIFLEAACFYPEPIRRSAIRHKTRTEASMRFEKSLNPNQNTLGIKRFLKLVDDAGISMNTCAEIASVGTPATPIVITISHEFIQQRIGTTVASDFIVKTLQKLGFGVEQQKDDYEVTVPTFRCIKDIEIKEDVLEEICRFFGYKDIPFIVPKREMKPFSIEAIMRLRSIKQLMAYALKMREVWNYAFFDESFLKKLGWEPSQALSVQNPVSENWQRLATTLIPLLLKNIDDNVADYDQLRFFEWGRTWSVEPEQEQQVLAGIMFDKKNDIDFYDAKNELMNVFNLLNISIVWKQVEDLDVPWFAPYQTAYLIHDGEQVGIAGKINRFFLQNISEGDAFLFEINGDFLLTFKQAVGRYVVPSKFPAIERDLSILVPVHKTVDHLKKIITSIHPSIVAVSLIDVFEKPEWDGKKAVTFRIKLQESDRTLSGQEADEVWDKVTTMLKKDGARIR